MVSRGCQLEDYVFQSGLNFVNFKCQVVEMCNLRPIYLLISTIWHFKFPKLRPLWKKLWIQYLLIDTPYSNGPFGSTYAYLCFLISINFKEN